MQGSKGRVVRSDPPEEPPGQNAPILSRKAARTETSQGRPLYEIADKSPQ